MPFFTKFIFWCVIVPFFLALSSVGVMGMEISENNGAVDKVVVNKKEIRKEVLENALRGFGRKNYDCKKSEILFSPQLDGYSFAHYYRGLAYYEGICAQKSKRLAYYEFGQGATLGNLDAFYFVGLMSYAGVGVKQDVGYANRVFKVLIRYKHDKTLKLMEKLKELGLIDEAVLDGVLSRQAQQEVNNAGQSFSR